MNYDQIIRELKKLGLEPVETGRGANKHIFISFRRKDSKIEGSMSLEFVLNQSKMDFHSSIYEEETGKKHHMLMRPKNQTEFFKIIKELKTTNKKLLIIRNRESIIEAKKEVEKLTKQFRDVRFRLGERKLWLKLLKGEIDRKEMNIAIRKLIAKRDSK